MDATIQVRQRGALTLPVELRAIGTTSRRVTHIGCSIWMASSCLRPWSLWCLSWRAKSRRRAGAAGLSIEELLTVLREQRTQYTVEKAASSQDA